jgi:hypothetical protein
MLDYLLTLIRHLRGRQPPLPDLPQDPDAGVRQPRWRGPGGRESAVAVPEPAPEMHVDAVGRVVVRTDTSGLVSQHSARLSARLRGQVLYFNIQLPLRPHPSDEIQDLTP